MNKKFLDYLEDMDSKKIISTKQSTDIKPKVLCLNVEVRTVDGAKLVIEKLEDWISRQKKENKVSESNKPKIIKKIPPKKVIKSPIMESRQRAVDILDGIMDKPVNLEEQNQEININKSINQLDLGSTLGHASALL